MLGHFRVEVVHEHSQRRLGLPALRRQLRPACRPDVLVRVHLQFPCCSRMR
ncbi:hypothetical protein ACFPRL_32345 [Pseudoclavibacter helvolus]